MKDIKKVFSTMCANSHSENQRSTNDFYATDPIALGKLLTVFHGSGVVWEPAAGMGHLSKTLKEAVLFDGTPMFPIVYSSDLFQYENSVDEITTGVDFLNFESDYLLETDIITNPPYVLSEQFIRKSISLIDDGFFVAMFLPIRYLEGKKRYSLFKEYPLYKVVIMSSRIECSPTGRFGEGFTSAQGYAWFIWQKGFKGNCTVEWVL